MSQNTSAVTQQWVDITPDLRGYLAHPADDRPHPVVLVFIEVFGVNAHFQKIAARLAEAGFTALVPDIYHGRVFDYSDSSSAIAHLRTLDDDQVMREAAFSLDFLGDQPCAGEAAGALGFCMGGRYAFLANAAFGSRLRASVAFYGGGIAPEHDAVGRKPLLDRVPEMQAPLLLQYGSSDQSIQPAEHARIVEALSSAHKRYSLEVYPGVGHAFFCDERPNYDPDAAAQGWQRTLDFFHRHLGD